MSHGDTAPKIPGDFTCNPTQHTPHSKQMKLKTEQETASFPKMSEAISRKRRDAVDRPAPPHAKLLTEASLKPFVMGDKAKLPETHFGF